MEHYTVFSATPSPATNRKIPAPFWDLFPTLEVGSAFAFPVDAELKDPLAPFRRAGRQVAETSSRYRWEHDGKGNATVYRVK